MIFKYILIFFVLISIYGCGGSLTASVDKCTLETTCYHCIDNPLCGWCSSMNKCYKRETNSTTPCPQALAGECKFFSNMLVVTTVVIFFACMLGAAGGIGGGAMYTPILMVILGLTPHQAIPVAKITISGVGIGSYLVTWRIRHPKADRPIIDYDLANIFEPSLLLGTIVGVYLNVTFPSYIIVILLAFTLLIASYKTLKKALEIHRAEKNQVNDTLSINETPSSITSTSIYNEDIFNDSLNEDLEILLKKDAKTFPMKKIFTIIFVFLYLMIVVILKGNQTGKSIIGVKCGTWQFWLILASAVPFVLTVTYMVSRKLARRHEEKVAASFKFLKEDIKYTPKVTVLLPFMSFFAGIGAGFFGIGAGMILSPIMIELGVIPQVTAATSAFTVIFTASSTSIQFIILGRLDWQAAVWFWVIGFFASILGQVGVAYLVKKYKKQSYVNFLIFIAIASSTIALVSVQTLGVVKEIKNHNLPGFQPICSANGPSLAAKFNQMFEL